TQILVHVSFLLLLNIVNHLLDALTYCGLVGQVLLGVFWGTPLGGLLPRTTESTVVTLGYLGLILIVYEGGLNTALRPLMQNLVLSSIVAATGIALPIALSFLLGPLAGATSLQCFAAGAALSATSLGTTFTILASAGMADTRLGTVLTSAAMMDDVIGLVMIQVVASLGGSGGNVSGEAVARPVGASVGLLIAVVIGGWGLKRTLGTVEVKGWGETLKAKVVMQTAMLLAVVTAASYAGASVLFAAFLAGAAVGWWDDVRTRGKTGDRVSGVHVFETYYSPINRRLLAPFFFASIGFSIPIRQMFAATTVWKGLVYSLLMVLGKLATGVWLLPVSPVLTTVSQRLRELRKLGVTPAPPIPHTPQSTPTTTTTEPKSSEAASPAIAAAEDAKPPKSLYPASILGLAMVARGEVAFLIASVAQSSGIFDSSEGLYLIVVWAAMVCTIAGPLGVGSLVRRVKALENAR
ncbi:Cation/H+ exchanger, partial [Tricharina praecox]|uniref:Cation/H+ exchanger n=1 Tax=Tricharina praecox TaxID=43433 RepID=UPI0022202C2C